MGEICWASASAESLELLRVDEESGLLLLGCRWAVGVSILQIVTIFFFLRGFLQALKRLIGFVLVFGDWGGVWEYRMTLE